MYSGFFMFIFELFLISKPIDQSETYEIRKVVVGVLVFKKVHNIRRLVNSQKNCHNWQRKNSET